jgi:hypothetical protein
MEKSLAKARRTEEFNRQFQDDVDRGVFQKLMDKQNDVYKGPINYNTMVEAYKNGLFVVNPQNMQEQKH